MTWCFRSELERLSATSDLTVTRVSRFIISHCSRKHLMEIAVSKACSTHTAASLANLRRLIFQLGQRLEILIQADMNHRVNTLSASIKSLKESRLLLRKVYRMVYMSMNAKACSRSIHRIVRRRRIRISSALHS